MHPARLLPPTMRVCSLLPSATELLCAIGAKDLLVGRSHEDNYPTEISDRPILTARATIETEPGRINDEVTAFVAAGKSLYHIDEATLTGLKPDLILTQDVCNVCAVDFQTVERIASRMNPQPRVLSLNPQSLEDVVSSALELGQVLGPPYDAQAGRYTEGLERRISFVEKRGSSGLTRTKVGFIEWTDPIFVGGHWTPQMIHLAGGEHTLNPAQGGTKGGDKVGGAGKSFPVTTDIFAASDPDLIIVSPCGFDLTQAHNEALGLCNQPWFRALRAVQAGRVYAVDGDAMFNRPGPRLVDALEWLGSVLHPNDNDLATLAKCFPCIHVKVPEIGSAPPSTPQTLVPVISIEELHLAACNAGEAMYQDPTSKLFVMTSLALRKQGKCCGNKCRHCPYGHYNVPAQKRANIILSTTLLRVNGKGRVHISNTTKTHILFWSGGKDSYLTYLALQSSGAERIVLLTTTDGEGRVPHQEVSAHAVVDQGRALRLDHMIVPLPPVCANTDYIVAVTSALAELGRVYGECVLVFGDLRLQDLVDWRRASFPHFECRFPLLHTPYAELHKILFEKNVVITMSAVRENAHGICVGDVYDSALVARLPPAWDSMGENGEFHTLVTFTQL